MNSKLMDYNRSLTRIKEKIERLNKFGINTEKLENNISMIENSIITETNIEENIGGVAVLKRMKVEPAYNEALNDLKNIENSLDEYENMLFIRSTIENIENTSSSLMNDSKLYDFKTKILKCINDLNNLEIYDYQTVTELSNKVYECAYKIIKYELIINGKSEIFNYINSYDKGIEFINNLVKEDLEKLNNKYYKHNLDKINNLISSINQNDDNYYANEDLIFMIAYKDDDLNKICTKSLDTTINIKKEETNRIIEISKASDELKEKAKSIKWQRIKYIAISAWFSCLMMSGIFSQESAIDRAKSQCIVSGYETTVESYDSYSNKVSNEIIYSTMDKNDVIVTFYGETDKNGNRSYENYEFEKSNVENIKDYANLSSKEDNSKSIKYDETTQSTDEAYVDVKKALVVDKNDTKDIVDQNAFVKKYKSKSKLYFIMQVIITFNIGSSFGNLIVSFISKDKRRKSLIDEKKKFDDEFEIHINNYEIENNKYELLKDKKEKATGYPEFYYDSMNENKVKELIKNKKK